MRPLIVGSGFLGRAVKAEFRRAGKPPVSTYRSRCGLGDEVQFDLFSQNLADLIDLNAVDTIVIASKIEDSIGTDAVLRAMHALFRACENKRVVYVSSDAVFDGERGNYIETDAPNPATLYGLHKLQCENILRQQVRDHCIVRSSYIYGYSMGQLDPRLNDTVAKVRAGQEVHKFIDMFKSPVGVNQLAEIIAMVSSSTYRGLLHACGQRLSVHEFFAQSLSALGEDVRRLIPVHIPRPVPTGYLRDTSLDSSLLKKIFNIEPVSLAHSLLKTESGDEEAVPNNPAEKEIKQ